MCIYARESIAQRVKGRRQKGVSRGSRVIGSTRIRVYERTMYIFTVNLSMTKRRGASEKKRKKNSRMERERITRVNIVPGDYTRMTLIKFGQLPSEKTVWSVAKSHTCMTCLYMTYTLTRARVCVCYDNVKKR